MQYLACLWKIMVTPIWRSHKHAQSKWHFRIRNIIISIKFLFFLTLSLNNYTVNRINLYQYKKVLKSSWIDQIGSHSWSFCQFLWGWPDWELFCVISYNKNTNNHNNFGNTSLIKNIENKYLSSSIHIMHYLFIAWLHILNLYFVKFSHMIFKIYFSNNFLYSALWERQSVHLPANIVITNHLVWQKTCYNKGDNSYTVKC